MLLNDFDLIGSSKSSGKLTLKKDIFRINFDPSLLSTTNHFVSVTKDQETYFVKTFDSLEKAIKYVNDELCCHE